MQISLVKNISELSDYRIILLTKPPFIIHLVFKLLIILVMVIITWSVMTEVSLIVRAPGRIRPQEVPKKIYSAGSNVVLNTEWEGIISEVNYKEGDLVNKGDVLVKFDNTKLNKITQIKEKELEGLISELSKLQSMDKILQQQYGIKLKKAESELIEANQAINRLEKTRKIDIQIATTNLAFSKKEEDRIRELVKKQLIPKVELDSRIQKTREAMSELDKANIKINREQLETLKYTINVIEKDYSSEQEKLSIQINSIKNRISLIKLELESKDIDKKQTIIQSPVKGIITNGNYKVGDVVERGKVIFEISDTNKFYFFCFVKSEDIGHLKKEIPATIKLDSFDYQKYGTISGKIVYISPDSMSLDENNIFNNKIVYLVKIELPANTIGTGEYKGILKLGMTGVADIQTEKDRLFTLFIRGIEQAFRLN